MDVSSIGFSDPGMTNSNMQVGNQQILNLSHQDYCGYECCFEQC